MPRLQGENALPRAHGLRVVVQAIRVRGAELEQHRQARGRILGERCAALEHFGHRGEVLVALGLLLEGVERHARTGLLVEDTLVQCDRLRPVVEALGGEPGHLHPEVPPHRTRADRFGLLGEEIVERLVRPPLGVELTQPVDRLAVSGIYGAQLLVALHRVLHVRELIEPAASDGAPKLRLHAGLRLELRLARLHGEQVAPPLQGLVDPGELADRGQIRRVELHDLRQHRDERRVALHLVAVHGRDLAKDGEPTRGVVLRQLVELLPQ